ncbi:ABC transporter permease subunit [Clostridium akagii]|uniref:ABC transporter permease subunit n=1 Tax=Clostridium akagii TaxID=91623 RepID=UPI000479BFC6|nr:ABC transporter permease subunit [Clostridium akagii]
MNIFIREMKANGKALIIWCISMIFLVIAGMAKFSTAGNNGVSYNQLMSQLPSSIKALFGLGTFDLSKVSGYYGVLFVYILLMSGIHSITLGANIISKEERDKTAEFLLAKPVSRNRIITEKVAASIVNIVILNLITLVSSLAIVKNSNTVEAVNKDIIMLMIGMFILQIIFFTLGTATAAIVKKPNSAANYATIIITVMYLLSVIIEINNKLTFLKILTPFKYFDSKDLMYGSGFDHGFLILSIIIIFIALSSTYIFYKKRDLNV